MGARWSWGRVSPTVGLGAAASWTATVCSRCKRIVSQRIWVASLAFQSVQATFNEPVERGIRERMAVHLCCFRYDTSGAALSLVHARQTHTPDRPLASVTVHGRPPAIPRGRHPPQRPPRGGPPPPPRAPRRWRSARPAVRRLARARRHDPPRARPPRVAAATHPPAARAGRAPRTARGPTRRERRRAGGVAPPRHGRRWARPRRRTGGGRGGGSGRGGGTSNGGGGRRAALPASVVRVQR